MHKDPFIAKTYSNVNGGKEKGEEEEEGKEEEEEEEKEEEEEEEEEERKYEDESLGVHDAYHEERRPVANASATVERHDHHVWRQVLSSGDTLRKYMSSL